MRMSHIVTIRAALATGLYELREAGVRAVGCEFQLLLRSTNGYELLLSSIDQWRAIAPAWEIELPEGVGELLYPTQAARIASVDHSTILNAMRRGHLRVVYGRVCSRSLERYLRVRAMSPTGRRYIPRLACRIAGDAP